MLKITNKLHAMVFFPDFEKAFNSIDHEFMFRCLKHFNFGNMIINWIKMFYNGAKSKIINNGNTSDFFSIKRGVRQGCPLSSYIFIICIELLSYEINRNKRIKGVTIEGHEVKHTLFADDATFITNGSRGAFEELIYTLDNFGNISSLKLNVKKCKVLRAGSLVDSNIKYVNNKPFIWGSDQASSLGMVFHTNRRRILELNLEPKIRNFNNCLKQWQHRKLTLLGKVTVIKNLALPKLVYPLTILQNPSHEDIERI